MAEIVRVPGEEIKPQYVNKFQLIVSGDGHFRIVFGDVAMGGEGTFHSAVIMSVADAIQLAEAIPRLIEQNRAQAAAGKPAGSTLN